MGHIHTGTLDTPRCHECGAPRKYMHYATFDSPTAEAIQRNSRITWLNPEDEGYPQPPYDKWAEYDRRHPYRWWNPGA